MSTENISTDLWLYQNVSHSPLFYISFGMVLISIVFLFAVFLYEFFPAWFDSFD